MAIASPTAGSSSPAAAGTPAAPGGGGGSGATPRKVDPRIATREKSIQLVGRTLFGLILALGVLLLVLSGAAAPNKGFTFLWVGWTINHSQVLILGVMTAGALGGCIHVATSFADYVGNAEYKSTWQWWYSLRPFIGASLALAFYFLIRGGLLSLTAGTTQQDPNFYGMVGISFLVGMFSKQATDKLDDVFDTLFKSNKDNERKDGMEPKVPMLKSINPASVPVGTPGQQVVLSGTNLSGARLKVNGVARAVDSVKDDRIELSFTAEELAAEAKYVLTVENDAGAAATTLEFEVVERREGGGDEEGADARGGDAGLTQPRGTVDTSTTTIPDAPAGSGAGKNKP